MLQYLYWSYFQFQVASRGKRNKIGAMVSFQLQLLLLVYLGPEGSAFPPDWFPLSFPGGPTIRDGSHLQHGHLQRDDSSLLRPRLPVSCQSIRLRLNDCRWVLAYHVCTERSIINQLSSNAVVLRTRFILSPEAILKRTGQSSMVMLLPPCLRRNARWLNLRTTKKHHWKLSANLLGLTLDFQRS